MESQRVSLVLKHFTDLKGLRVVVPDTHGLVCTASAHKLFFDTDIHTVDATGVEGEDEILILRIISWAFDVDRNSHQLVVFS